MVRLVNLSFYALAVIAVITLLSIPVASASQDQKILRTSWASVGGDMGFPSPFAYAKKGSILVSYSFDSLIWRDKNGNFTGLLAKSWNSSPDGLVWTFNLRDNVKWQDGVSFTANDVKFTYDYIEEKAGMGYAAASSYDTSYVKDVTVVDNDTVVITLNSSYAPFLNSVAGVIPIIPEHIWKNVQDPTTYTEKNATIGTGPFVFEDYNPVQASYKYVANDNYYLGKPVCDVLEVIQVSNAVQSLENGDVDIASLRMDDVNALKDAGSIIPSAADIKAISGPGYWIYRLWFNMQDNAQLNDTAVRQAMYYSINTSDVVARALEGGGDPGSAGYVPPFSDWYNPDVTQYPYDPAKANQVLDAAGYNARSADGVRLTPDGRRLEFQMIYQTDLVDERVAELLQNYFKMVGIGLVMNPKADSNSLNALTTTGDFQIALVNSGMQPDPARMLNTLPANSNWSNDEFNTLAIKQIGELNVSERKADVDCMQAIIANDLPTISIVYSNTYSSENTSKFDGLFFTPNGVSGGMPTEFNKLAFIYGTWNGGAGSSRRTITPTLS